MPELPEVEIVRQALEPILQNRIISNVQLNRLGLRYLFDPDFISIMQGARVQKVDRRAKYILLRLDNQNTLVWHLGMSGRVKIFKNAGDYLKENHDHVVLEQDRGSVIVFNDPRRFGFMRLFSKEKPANGAFLQRLGPEPLGNSFNAEVLKEKLSGKAVSIKNALLDQSVVAGLGNIYVSEALYYASILPERNAGSLNESEIERLVSAIRMVLEKALAAGGSSLKDYVHTDGSLGYFQHMFAVYNREGAACPDCNCDISKTGGIKKIRQAGRSTYFCPRKQA